MGIFDRLFFGHKPSADHVAAAKAAAAGPTTVKLYSIGEPGPQGVYICVSCCKERIFVRETTGTLPDCPTCRHKGRYKRLGS